MSYVNKGSMPVTVTVSRAPDRSGNYICNGTADNIEIQAAIDYVDGLGGGKIILMRGTYVVNATIIHRSNITLLGVDQRSTVIQLAAGVNLGATPIILLIDAGNVELGQLEIDGNNGNGSICRGIEWNVNADQGINRMYIHDIYLHNASDYGMFFRATVLNSQGKLNIERVYIYDCGNYGVYVSGGVPQVVFRDSIVDTCYSATFDSAGDRGGWIISGSIFRNSDGVTTTIGSGLRISGGGFGGKVSDCYSYNNNYAGFLVSQGDGVLLVNCVANGNGQHAAQSGFKTGNADTLNVTFNGCISYDNTACGFSGSDGSSFIKVLDCVAYENNYDGIYFPYGMCAAIGNYLYNNGQIALANRQNGILVGAVPGTCDNCILEDNIIWDDQGVATQLGGIRLDNADDTLIEANKFIDLGTGIDISNAACERTRVFNNSFPGCTIPLTDSGTDTILPSKPFQFTEVTGGTAAIQVASPTGCYVSDANGTAIAWGQLPVDIQQVVRLKVWAVAKDGPAAAGGQMHCEFTFNAGASNAAYNTAGKSWNVVNKDSEEADYVADDVVHWILTDADTGDSEISALAAGDRFEILAIYESAASPDGDTDAKFSVIEIEYV